MAKKHDPADLERPLTEKEFADQPSDIGETSAEREQHLEPASGAVERGNLAPEDQTGVYRTVLVDFDGVLHSYISGWKGDGDIPDPPNNGAVEFVEYLMEMKFNPVIFTTRARSVAGADAVKAWLVKHGFPMGLEVTCEKLSAVMILDDRAVRFRGNFQEIKNFVKNNQHRIPSGSLG